MLAHQQQRHNTDHGRDTVNKLITLVLMLACHNSKEWQELMQRGQAGLGNCVNEGPHTDKTDKGVQVIHAVDRAGYGLCQDKRCGGINGCGAHVNNLN
jgi:hypothetical protein